MSAPSWFDWKKSTTSPSSVGPCRDPGVDLVERLVPVDLGLARPDEVEVRALRGPGPSSSRRSRSGRPAARPRRARRPPGRRRRGRRRRSAVGSTQRSRPAACFLSVARWSMTVGERVGERLDRETQRVEQRADASRALGRGDAELDADPGRGAQAVGDRLAVEQPAVAGGRLDGVAERVTQVERDPAAGRVALALVGQRRPRPWPSPPARRARRRRPTRRPPDRRARSRRRRPRAARTAARRRGPPS